MSLHPGQLAAWFLSTWHGFEREESLHRTTIYARDTIGVRSLPDERCFSSNALTVDTNAANHCDAIGYRPFDSIHWHRFDSIVYLHCGSIQSKYESNRCLRCSWTDELDSMLCANSDRQSYMVKFDDVRSKRRLRAVLTTELVRSPAWRYGIDRRNSIWNPCKERNATNVFFLNRRIASRDDG